MSIEIIEASLSGSEARQRRPPGELLFMEGQAPEGIYILHSGTVELFFTARNGSPKTLRIAERGHILGLSTVVMHHDHECSAMTVTECEVGFIDRDDLLRALAEKPAVWFSVLGILSRDV